MPHFYKMENQMIFIYLFFCEKKIVSDWVSGVRL